MKNKIFIIGLSREETYILKILTPVSYDYVIIQPDELKDFKDYERIIQDSRCIFVNPKKIIEGQLKTLVQAHACAISHGNVPVLLLTGQPTIRQSKNEINDYELIHQINLHSLFHCKYHKVWRTLKKTNMPTWSESENLFLNKFNAGWYLIDIETTGISPTRDSIIAIHFAYMQNYKIQSEETIFVNPGKVIDKDIEESTGITNEVLKKSKSIDEVVCRIENLKHDVPIIFWSEDYEASFFEVAWNMSGKEFNLPYIALDSLAAYTFGYTLRWKIDEFNHSEYEKKIDRSYVENKELALLYDYTLSIFEALENRYDVHSPNGFDNLFGFENNEEK